MCWLLKFLLSMAASLVSDAHTHHGQPSFSESQGYRTREASSFGTQNYFDQSLMVVRQAPNNEKNWPTLIGLLPIVDDDDLVGDH